MRRLIVVEKCVDCPYYIPTHVRELNHPIHGYVPYYLHKCGLGGANRVIYDEDTESNVSIRDIDIPDWCELDTDY